MGNSTFDASKPVLVIHGPNLNLLGTREPEIYGSTSLEQLNGELKALAESCGLGLQVFQSNTEGEIITAIQQAMETTGGLIINPAGYTHTSVAIRDALLAYARPVIEVHLSNIYAREGFRAQSYVSPVVTGVISGLGLESYRLALKWFADNR